MNIFIRVFRLEKQQLRNNQIGHMIFNLTNHEDHALFEQAGVDIVRALSTSTLLLAT